LIAFAGLEAWFGDHPWLSSPEAVVAVLVVVGVTWVVRRRRAAWLGAGSAENNQPA
jgi:hypothetical protein